MPCQERIEKMIKVQKEFQKINTDSSNPKFKTLHFRQENVHDFAWFADKKWLVQKGVVSSKQI